MSHHFTTLETERLWLRPLEMKDCDPLFEVAQEPNIFQYFPTKSAWSQEKVEKTIQHQVNHWASMGYGQFAILLKQDNQFMGWCGLEYLPDSNETEVGYLLGHTFWGNGYGTEAAKASVEFGLRDIQLKEIIGLTDPLNIASQRVLEKSGLIFTRRQVYFGMEMFRFAIQA